MPDQAPEPIAKRQSTRGESYHGTAMEMPATPAAGHQGRRVVAADFHQGSPPAGTTIMGLPPRPSGARFPRRAGPGPGKRVAAWLGGLG